MTSSVASRSPSTAGRPGESGFAREKTAWLLIAALTLVGLVPRVWRLGDWNFQATEMFTLRDSVTLGFANPRPLIYLLNHYLVGSFRPLDELGLRLLPALFGILAVPVCYLLWRHLAGSRAALASAFLVALSPVLVLYSQLARYWSLVFLLCAVYPYALYLGIRKGSRGWLVLGGVCAVLAALAHPVSFVLLGGIALWLAPDLKREHLTRLWQQRAVRWAVGITGLLAVVALVRLTGLLEGWITMHDLKPGYGQFLHGPRLATGMRQVMYLAGFAESLTFPVVLLGIAGVYSLWTRGDRSLGRLLACLAGFHIGFLTLVSTRTSVSFYYLLPAVPVFYLGAGIFIDQLFRLETPWRARWLLPALMLSLSVLAGAATLVSDARDGRRYDFRGSARWILPRLQAEDIVFSDQPMVMAHYLPEHPVQHLLLDLGPLSQAMEELRQAGRGGAMWIVAPAPSHARRPTLKQGGMIDWIYGNCQLRNTVGVGRYDFRQDYLNIFRCPSTGLGAAAAAP
jgi:Dolichyl-phosphate-mannose-protein mannosyltransferase